MMTILIFLITIVINNNLSGLIIAKYLTCLGWSGNQELCELSGYPISIPAYFTLAARVRQQWGTRKT